MLKYFLFSFSIAEKETKKLDKIMLPRARPRLARYRYIGMSG
jgi:hypothetical protein